MMTKLLLPLKYNSVMQCKLSSPLPVAVPLMTSADIYSAAFYGVLLHRTLPTQATPPQYVGTSSVDCVPYGHGLSALFSGVGLSPLVLPNTCVVLLLCTESEV